MRVLPAIESVPSSPTFRGLSEKLPSFLRVQTISSRQEPPPMLLFSSHQITTHMLHDQVEHQRRRWFTLFRRRALGDLYQGRYQ
jgi:hypothetical protein